MGPVLPITRQLPMLRMARSLSSIVLWWVQVWCDTTTGKVVQHLLISPTRLRTRSSQSLVVTSEVLASLKVLETSKRTTLARVDKADAVAVNDFYPSAGTNNAEFFAPADGQPGEMRIGCLSSVEAGGLGEGWADIMAMMVLAKKSDTATTRISIGAYVRNNPKGIRLQPYTTDMRVNSLTYGSLETRRREVHRIGEVWATMLWDVYWNLVTKHGFSKNLYDASQSEGNIVAMKIIIGGMCEIYKGFGNRGLGLGATRIRIDDFSIPPECERR
ncbi:hypothetical protein BASA81_006081 [Batrachochytrium salamandrivorans]|nr:hypothetical protein BASA81_006081 [Batrachochytrium salamandrivorans]